MSSWYVALAVITALVIGFYYAKHSLLGPDGSIPRHIGIALLMSLAWPATWLTMAYILVIKGEHPTDVYRARVTENDAFQT